MVKTHSKNTYKFKDSLTYILVKLTGYIVRNIPRRVGLYIGAFLGSLVYCFVKKRREMALKNLKMALGKEKNERELRRIAKKSFQNMGKMLIEFLNIPKYDPESLKKLVKIEGMGHFQDAMAKGKGVIGVSWHFGNWELIFQAISSQNYPSAAIVQPFKHPEMEETVTRYREKYGGHIIKRRFATRETFKLLRDGYFVIFMSDQNAREAGVFVNLFGIPASSPRGPIVFALRTGATILHVVDIRQEDDSHIVKISEPVNLEISGDLEGDIRQNTAKLNGMLENIVRQYPEQWLWMHNRWKTRPPGESHKILVLSDGKPGHYNQSLGIIDRMENVEMKIVEVKFKRKWRDNLLRLSTRLLWRLKMPKKFIKSMFLWAMEENSAKNLLETGYFNAILSTGSSLAAPNFLMGKLIETRTIVCTRPSPLGIKPFDLAILPEHSRPKKIQKNAIMTLGVPNRITPERVKSSGIELSQSLKCNEKRVIGLLLGGEDPYYSIPPEMSSKLCDVLIEICKEADFRIALTTSRRTDPKSEAVIKSAMNGNPVCCLLVLASEPLKENIVPGILGISDVVIVTEDSFSMVCEAASSGRRVVILETEHKKKGGHPKRRKVYKMLIELGYAKKAHISNLKEVVLDALNDTDNTKALDDAQVAADEIRKILKS